MAERRTTLGTPIYERLAPHQDMYFLAGYCKDGRFHKATRLQTFTVEEQCTRCRAVAAACQCAPPVADIPLKIMALQAERRGETPAPAAPLGRTTTLVPTPLLKTALAPKPALRRYQRASQAALACKACGHISCMCGVRPLGEMGQRILAMQRQQGKRP